ncbi:hypothetical protein [Amnibacterium sp.]|nr:hypothetical protein [Amnibacterium sp.]MCU1473123.1 hypothetical protein [Amnibacterium sp.]
MLTIAAVATGLAAVAGIAAFLLAPDRVAAPPPPPQDEGTDDRDADR